jgi:hypothetical protein
MTEYWAAVTIERDDAIEFLNELATEGSDLRGRLEAGQESARDALGEKGIYVATASIPEQIKLPPPEDVATLRDHAQAMVERGRGPFAWFILAVVFAAMPLVDAPDRR